MGQLTVATVLAIASGQGVTAWEVHQLCAAWLGEHGIETPEFRAPVQASEARGDWTASPSVRKALGKFAAAAKDEAEAGEWSWYDVNHLMANGIDPEAAKFIGYASPHLILALLHDLSAHTQAGPVG